MKKLYNFNQFLQKNVLTPQEQHHENVHFKDQVLHPKPHSYKIWGAPVPEKFKPPSVVKFDGKIDFWEHAAPTNTQMAVIGTSDSLKRMFLVHHVQGGGHQVFHEDTHLLSTSQQDLLRKHVYLFLESKHWKVSTTNMFNVLQVHVESLREYLSSFNEATIKVIHPNHKMFV